VEREGSEGDLFVNNHDVAFDERGDGGDRGIRADRTESREEERV